MFLGLQNTLQNMPAYGMSSTASYVAILPTTIKLNISSVQIKLETLSPINLLLISDFHTLGVVRHDVDTWSSIMLEALPTPS